MEYDALSQYSTGKDQIIALIDSGVSEFQSQIVSKNQSFVNGEFDTNGHGTMMCSIILGENNKFIGIAPDATIYSYKIVNDDGKIKPDVIVEAINMAIDDKVDIINISLGSYFDNDKIKNVIDKASKEGIIIVASSGDYGSLEMLYPAGYDCVISVGALDKNKKVWQDTDGKEICDILAPGVNITTVNQSGEVIKVTGTSQAAAIISGYLSLLKDYSYRHNKSLDYTAVKKILDDINSGNLSYVDALKYSIE